MLGAVLLSWIWSRVLVNCNGGPEVVDHYHLMATVRTVGLTVCFDDQGQPFVCPTTVPAPPIQLPVEIPDPGIGADVTTDIDPVADPDLLPYPAVGSMTAWPWPSPENPYPVVAVDIAGNVSGACP